VKGGQFMYDIFEQLLQSYGITAYKFCKETGISQSTISTWKKKRNIISGEIAQTIASYFNISVDYLMTGKEKEADKYYINEETAEMAQTLFENKPLRVLFDAAKDATPEDLETTYNMLMALKKKERGNNVD
jgi:transcriptional regulator with XRE-family HTH domain